MTEVVPFFLYGLPIVGYTMSEDDTCVPTTKFYCDEGVKHVNGAHIVERITRAAPLGCIEELLGCDVRRRNDTSHGLQRAVSTNVAFKGRNIDGIQFAAMLDEGRMWVLASGGDDTIFIFLIFVFLYVEFGYTHKHIAI